MAFHEKKDCNNQDARDSRDFADRNLQMAFHEKKVVNIFNSLEPSKRVSFM